LVYQQKIDEKAKTLRLWVRRKAGTKKRICSAGCGKHFETVHEVVQREVRDLPWSEYKATVVVELLRLRCRESGLRMEKVAQLPSKAPFSKRFEEAVGKACQGAAASHVAKQFGLTPATARAIELRYLLRRSQSRSKPAPINWGWTSCIWGKARSSSWW
jgi:transposase